MKNLHYPEMIIRKTRELKIPPKLLLITIAIIAEDKDVKEQQIFKKYRDEPVPGIVQKAARWQNSKSASTKASGIKAMLPLNINVKLLSYDGLGSIYDFLNPVEKILELHYKAWNSMLKAYKNISGLSLNL